MELIEEEDDDLYYCKQCGWKGSSSELITTDATWEDYAPFFCPKCMADEYSLSLADDYSKPDFWDKLKFFCRKISFYGFRHRWCFIHPPLKYLIGKFLKYDIKMYFRKLIKTIRRAYPR